MTIPFVISKTIDAYVKALGDAGRPLDFAEIVAATPGVNFFRLLKERKLIRDTGRRYRKPNAKYTGPRVSHYVLTAAGKAVYRKILLTKAPPGSVLEEVQEVTLLAHAEAMISTGNAITLCQRGVPKGFVLECRWRDLSDTWHEDVDTQRLSPRGFSPYEIEEGLMYFRLVRAT